MSSSHRLLNVAIMLFGYNTNGFAHHRLENSLAILAKLGYGSVAITLDQNALNPYAENRKEELANVHSVLKKLRLRCVIETGARFLLDPWHKHQPTMISPTELDRERRLGFLGQAVAIAKELDADAVSFWSGTPVDQPGETILWDRLVDGCRWLCDYAGLKGVRLAFEPEPGMFIDTLARFAELKDRVNHPLFGLTIDIGHLHCQGEVPISDPMPWSRPGKRWSS